MNVSLATERYLIDVLKQRKPADFTLFYNTYSSALYSVLIRLVSDPDQAQDLLQDMFVKVWLNAHQFDPHKGRLFTWLLTITRNIAFNELRDGKLRKTAEANCHYQLGESISPAYFEGIPNESLLTSLSPKHRPIVELIYLQGYTSQEVADRLNLPLGTVKTRLRMGLQQLGVFFSRDTHYYRHG